MTCGGHETLSQKDLVKPLKHCCSVSGARLTLVQQMPNIAWVSFDLQEDKSIIMLHLIWNIQMLSVFVTPPAVVFHRGHLASPNTCLETAKKAKSPKTGETTKSLKNITCRCIHALNTESV